MRHVVGGSTHPSRLTHKLISLLFGSAIMLALLAGCSGNHSFDGIYPAPVLPTPAVQIPAAPTGVTATAGNAQIAFAWSAVSGATSYNIYCSDTAGVTPATGTKTGSLTSSPYTMTSLSNGINYYCVVTAANSAGESGASSQVAAMPMPTGAISIPLTPGSSTNGTLPANGTTTLTFTFDGKEVTAAGTAIASPILEADLGTALPSGAGACTYVGAFQIEFKPTTITVLLTPATVGGSVGTSIKQGTTLNLMILQKGIWTAVSTLVVGTSGGLAENLHSVTLPGLLSPGEYALCQPTETTVVSNLGVALIGSDGGGYRTPAYESVQVFKLYDTNGNPLATPTVTYLNYPGADDIDGQAMTPDGSQGIVVDGGNTIRLFSNVQTGTPVLGTPPSLDVSAYGGDGDAIAIMPNGNEAVVSLDSDSQLVVVSGLLSGSPVVAETIPLPSDRDGLVSSLDGKVLLARKYDGLTVFAIAPITPVAGPLGGTVSYSYTQVIDMSTEVIGQPNGEDGRDGMAISPTDSSRAIIIDSNNEIYLLTGLPGTPTTPPAIANTLSIASAGSMYSVSITPDGKTAIIGTSAGLLMVSGVDTGTLAQVGSVYSPTYTLSDKSTATLQEVSTLGITLDGKYVAVCDAESSALLTIPITGTGFGAPVGEIDPIAVPDNDQLLIH